MRFILSVVFMLLLSVDIMADERGLGQIEKEMQEEQRVALVIGNSSYQRPLSVLNNTINDARAIKNILSTRGFDVIYREDISKRDFSNVLEEFYQKLGRGGVGLLYFSGHGLESSGQNYLIPTDAKIRAKSDTEFEAIALNKITKRMQSIGNRLNIVILDACRNDPFAKSVGTGGLAKAEPIGLFVSYATGAGQVASDGVMGENGLFTKYLIEYMQQPLTLQKVFQKTRKSVYSASSKSQFPAIYDQTINGDFYFTLPTKPTSTIVHEPESIKKDSDSKNITIVNGVMYQTYPSTSAFNWDEAKKYCDELVLDGYNDWRLSSFGELINISSVTPSLFKALIEEEKNLPPLLSPKKYMSLYGNLSEAHKVMEMRKKFREKKDKYRIGDFFLKKQFADNMCVESPLCIYWSSDEESFLGFSTKAYTLYFSDIRKRVEDKSSKVVIGQDYKYKYHALCVR